ncbi:MAG TPA: tetratricopeptide repeat protein, partial [Rudaea sp.]|nr:tetratricopeptide repeat protein [Rudaea sp.]
GNAWTVMGYHYTALGRYDRAREALTQAVRNVPLDEHAHYYLGLGELLQGRPAAALPHFEDSAHFLRLTGLAMAHHSLGDSAASNQDLQMLISRYAHILPYQVAEVYAWRGENDKAFEWLDRSYELHDASFILCEFDPLLRGLHSDPRYAALLKKLGLPPART